MHRAADAVLVRISENIVEILRFAQNDIMKRKNADKNYQRFFLGNLVLFRQAQHKAWRFLRNHARFFEYSF